MTDDGPIAAKKAKTTTGFSVVSGQLLEGLLPRRSSWPDGDHLSFDGKVLYRHGADGYGCVYKLSSEDVLLAYDWEEFIEGVPGLETPLFRAAFALYLLKAGRQMRRRSWVKEAYIFVLPDTHCVTMREKPGVLVHNWRFNYRDLLARDWEEHFDD